MVDKATSPAAAARTGLGNNISLTADGSEPTPQNFAKQAIVDSLNRDFAAEAARLQIIASSRAGATKLMHVADNFALHDFENGKRAFEAARQYGIDIAANIRKLEAELEAEAVVIKAEAFR